MLVAWSLVACQVAVLDPLAGTAMVASLPDPCTLLKSDEVNRAFGRQVSEPTVEQELGDAECLYETPDAPGRPAVVVELTKVSPRNATFSQRAQFFRNEGATQFPGLGAEAYARDGQVLTQKPGIILFVSLSDSQSDGDRLKVAARGLARLILDRLP